MSRENIIARIKKLLALAKDNMNVAEATAAALKAQKLVADYDVSKDELYKEEPEVITEVKSNDIVGNPWSKHLANAIANNFRCRYFTQSSGYTGWSGRMRTTSEHIVFMGYETDAEAATVTFDHLFDIGGKLANAEVRRVRKQHGTATGVRNSFLLGFVKGIETELEKQTQALMLIRPQAVNDYAANRTKGFRPCRSTVRNAYKGTSFDNGTTAGRDAVRAARLSGQKAIEA